MRNYVENARLCGNMRKITKCAENNKLLKTVNCAIPHPSHLMGASVTCQFQMQFLIQFTKHAQHFNSMIAGDIRKEKISLTNSNSKLRQIVLSKVEWMKNSYAFKIF